MAIKGLLGVSILATGVMLSALPAQAAGFSSYSFDTTFTPDNPDPKADITLISVKKSNGTVINDFSLVHSAVIQQNTALTGVQLGPGSKDCGDLVTNCTPVEIPDANDIVSALGNLNLNSIIDTEDKNGTSVFDLFFDQPVNSFFFWERGMNSDLLVEALDASGNVVGDSFKITRDLWGAAGYSIDTTEILAAQQVGSYGLKFASDVAGVRLSSFNKGVGSFNGPDYKVVATKVPEPASLAALGLSAGALLLSKRRRQLAGEAV